MATDYDDISSEYQRSKFAPWRTYLEAPSFMALVGEVSGLSVLDLACGDGFYTRRLSAAGAKRVVGVDSSPAMITLAQEADRDVAEPGGRLYRIGDARTLDVDEHFDLVTAAYLLNYAADRDQLGEMCESVRRHLRPGGRFVGINSNPDLGPGAVDYRRYGFQRLVPRAVGNGSPFTFRNYEDNGSWFDISVYHLDAATHDEAFRAGGLSAPHWRPMTVSDDGLAAYEPGYWDTFLEQPPVVLFESRG